jgi:hypothetical protein
MESGELEKMENGLLGVFQINFLQVLKKLETFNFHAGEKIDDKKSCSG